MKFWLFFQPTDEDSALLAILEQRLSRKPESRRIYSDSEMGLQDAGDIPLRIVGQQQRSGHVVDGSSQAFTGPTIPGNSIIIIIVPESPWKIDSSTALTFYVFSSLYNPKVYQHKDKINFENLSLGSRR